MLHPLKTVITGTGSFIPADIKTNNDFIAQDFYDDKQQKITSPASEVVKKLEMVTGIAARRYADKEINTSDMAAMAGAKAIADAGIDPETIDQLIVAHNFGNVSIDTIQSDAVPSLASRVKHALGIKNPSCIAYDILFGCPGWIQGLIQADAFIKSGLAKRCLVIGAEALSRVIDKYDRDSMIFSDGAGAVIAEAAEAESAGAGILGFVSASYTEHELEYINMAKSYFPDADPRVRYIKMLGRKVYEFALKRVPVAMKECLEQSNVDILDLKKIFIHQANAKMDAAIVKAFYLLYNINEPPHVMPMNIHELGNNSVATIPTLFDMVRKGLLPDQQVNKGDIVLFASVGAGMNINAICYRL